MATIDYKVKYEQAIADARAIIKDYKERHLDDIAKRSEEDFSAVFPELKESEDEKWIPKEIAKYLKEKGGFRSCWLAWLEKQGELVNSLSKGLDNAHELIDGLIQKNNSLIEQLEKIQGEQKPLGFNIGDEITVNGQICKVVAVEQKPVEWSSEQKHTLQTDDVPNKSSTAAPLRTGAIGFDGEPMESKPCEQKSAAWSEEDERKFSDILTLLWGGVNRHYNASDLSTWFKVLKDRVIPQPKSGWSEEDEINLGKAIWYVENPAPMVAKDSMLVEWLKNLRGRVQSQHKQEWNEDDEMMLGKCIDAASGYYSPEDKQSMKDWLKSLRPNSQWKLSDEQMAALDDFIYAKYPNIEKHGAVVKSLYQDLKKLKQ